jgi:hypothetical protein
MEASKRKITTFYTGRDGEPSQLWRQVDGLPYYAQVSILDAVHWGLWKERYVVRQEGNRYWVREPDGEVTRWRRTARGRYVHRKTLTGERWQEYVRRHPVQCQTTEYLSDEEVRRYPLLRLSVRGIPGA